MSEEVRLIHKHINVVEENVKKLLCDEQALNRKQVSSMMHEMGRKYSEMMRELRKVRGDFKRNWEGHE